jgi:hypothetical protein
MLKNSFVFEGTKVIDYIDEYFTNPKKYKNVDPIIDLLYDLLDAMNVAESNNIEDAEMKDADILKIALRLIDTRTMKEGTTSDKILPQDIKASINEAAILAAYERGRREAEQAAKEAEYKEFTLSDKIPKETTSIDAAACAGITIDAPKKLIGITNTDDGTQKCLIYNTNNGEMEEVKAPVK